ncbi:hypothetical protein Bbelb_361620 [Branchiostoma belcheri]|nr:hypothetical protein Bbelb_361620 [Branchiostoma belcheri]
MRTPTLVVAIILAMAMAGDSANIERLLHQLRLLAGEETMDDASMTHTKGKSVDTGETQLLDLVKKLSLESKEPEPIDGDVNGEGDTDVDPNYEMAETQDPTLKDFSGQKVPDVEENYDMAGLGDQNPTSEEGEAEGGEVTEQNYDQSETGEEYSTSTEDGSEQAPDFGQNYDMTGFQNQDSTSEGVEEEGSTDVEQNYDVAKIGEKDSTLKEDEQAPDVGQNYGMTGRENQDPTSKEVGGEKGPDVEQKYDMTGREDPDQSLRVPWSVRSLNAIHLLSLATMDYEVCNPGMSLGGGCPGGYVYHQPSRLCYKAFNDATTYNGAVSGCSSDGGTLAMPRDNATNNFLIDLKNAVDNNAYFRFGLTDVHREGVWVWDDNVPLGDFTAWGPGQPDNYPGVEEEDCAEYLTESSSNTWNDGNCAHADRKFICQVFPPGF